MFLNYIGHVGTKPITTSGFAVEKQKQQKKTNKKNPARCELAVSEKIMLKSVSIEYGVL